MTRIVFAKLADLSSSLPMPTHGGRLFSAEGETIDADHPFWLGALGDRSIVEAERPAEIVNAPEPVPSPALAPVPQVPARK